MNQLQALVIGGILVGLCFYGLILLILHSQEIGKEQDKLARSMDNMTCTGLTKFILDNANATGGYYGPQWNVDSINYVELHYAKNVYDKKCK